MTDEPTKQDEINVAAEGATHSFAGARLHPFSFARQACWQRCGWEAAESELESCAAIVFLCTLGDEIVERVKVSGQEIQITGKDIIDSARKTEGIRAFRRRFEEWADGVGISGNNELGREVNRVGYAIWLEKRDSHFVPVAEKKGKPPDPNA